MGQGPEESGIHRPKAGGPAAGRVEIWIADLDAIPPDPALLDAEDRERERKLATPDLKRRFATTRTLLKRLLRDYLEVAPLALRFETGAQGKPRLAGTESLHFNLTHSQGLAAFAFTRAGEIGVDVEIIHPLASLEGMARRCLSASELRSWWRLGEGERLAAFFRAWTRKEAVLKALGAGVSGGLANVEVGFGTVEPLEVVGLGGPVSGSGPWTLREIDVPSGAMGAVAVAASEVVIEHRRLA